MLVSAQTQAILLLTAWFSKSVNDSPKPLTTKEWAKFALWLKDHNLNPEDLLNGHLKSSLQGWTDKFITPERIEQLINRGSALALAMEKWTRTGIWIMTRSDGNYPVRLKQLLKTDSPAVLFGCGNPGLLNKGGIAIVGARNADNGDLQFSNNIGNRVAEQGYSVVSGGARGVDEAAMLGALTSEGTVIGVLADSLLKSATSNKYRKYLMSQNLVLISPYYPEAGFNAGNAMSRNKYIYCLSELAVVVQSGTEGGTWNGAIENLKNRWVPLWVKESNDPESGNALLISKGGIPLSDDLSELSITNLVNQEENIKNVSPEDLFQKSAVKEHSTEAYDNESVIKEINIRTSENNTFNDINIYQFFLVKLIQLTQKNAKTPDELSAELDVTKSQLNTWLKKAIQEKKVRKLSKPVRYQSLVNLNQMGMFD